MSHQSFYHSDPSCSVFYVYSGFNKHGSFEVGFISCEPTMKSESDVKEFAETRLGLERVVVQTRTNPQE